MQATTSHELNKAHHNMVQKQIREQFMLDDIVLNAIATVPRHFFVPTKFQNLAYADMKISLPHSECMMTPNEEARMLGGLDLKPSDKVLEIGTGTGYVTALLATLCHSVFSLDIHADFIEQAQTKLTQLKFSNVITKVADGVSGYEAAKPYDVICITGGLYYISQSLLDQVRPEGRIFAILGKHPNMVATVFKKEINGQWQQTQLFETEINYLHNIPSPEPFQF